MEKTAIYKGYDLRSNNFRQIASRAVSVALFTVIVVWMFYQTAFDQQTKRLVEIAQSRAALIQAIFIHADSHNSNSFDPIKEQTLKQLRDAQSSFPGIGETGEFVLAQQVNDQIVFQLHHRHGSMDTSAPVFMTGHLAEPMRRALNGKTGTMQGLDYRGELVLAAYQPIPKLNWGIVAKIDLGEIRAPFIHTGILSMVLAALIVSVSTFFVLRSMRPFIKALEDSEERFRELAYHDILTKLPNRMLFEERCDQALIRAHRKNTKLAVLFLDLNEFKKINDNYGHAVGDELLQLVAHRLKGSMREMDTVARLAGDEFIILMEELPHCKDITVVVKNLLLELSIPFEIQDHEIIVLGSVGISQYPEDGNDRMELMMKADSAMYEAKQLGHGEYAFCSTCSELSV